MSSSKRYAESLDELEQLRADGKISTGQYEVRRQNILNQMKPVSWSLRLVGILAFVILLIMALMLLGAIDRAMMG